MSDLNSPSLPSQKKKNGVLSLAARFEQQQDSAPPPPLSFKGRARKASVSSPFSSFASNSRESPRFPSSSAFLEKTSAFLKKPLTSPTQRKLNIPKTFSSGPDPEKPTLNKSLPGKLADLSTTTTFNENIHSTPRSASDDTQVGDDELPIIPEPNIDVSSDISEISNFTPTFRSLDPNSSEALEESKYSLENSVENSLVESVSGIEHEPSSKQAEPSLLSKSSHLSSPTIDSDLPVDQASEHVLESTSQSESLDRSIIQQTPALTDDHGSTDSHAAPQIVKDGLASLSASETVSKISNELHFDHSKDFEETLPAVNTIEDDLVSSPVVSQDTFVSESNVMEKENLPISEPVVGLEQNFDFSDALSIDSETIMEDKKMCGLTENQSTFENSDSAADVMASPIDSPQNFTSAISESSLPLVNQNISDTPLNFTETRESLSHIENTSNNNLSIESTNTMSNLQDKLEDSVPEPLLVSRPLVNEEFLQNAADSTFFEPTSEIADDPQPDFSKKVAEKIDLTATVSKSGDSTDLPVSDYRDIELDAESDTPRGSFESLRETEHLSQSSFVKKLSSASTSPKNSSDINESSSESEIEESVMTTSLGNVVPTTITGLADTANDLAIDTAASFGATDSVESKSEALTLADKDRVGEDVVPRHLNETEVLKSPVDSLSSNDSFASASESIVESSQHIVESSDRDQMSPKTTTNEAESDSVSKSTIIGTATAAAIGAAASVSLLDSSSKSASSEQEIELENESELPSTVNTVPVLSINDNVLGSPVSFTVSRDPFMSTLEAGFDGLQQSPLERSFENSEQSKNLEFDNAELEEEVDPVPVLASTVGNAHASPIYSARSPGAAIWTPAPPSTDSSPELEPWSPKEVHFSLPNSPLVATGLIEPAPLNDAEPLQLSDVKDPSSDQLLSTENQLDVSQTVKNDSRSIDFASREIDNESKTDSLESSVIEQKNLVSIPDLNNLSDDDAAVEDFHREESHAANKDLEINEHTSSTNPFVLGGLAATTVAAATAAGVLHSEFKGSIDSLTDSEFVGTVNSEPKENLDSLGSVSTDRNLDHSLPDLSNTMDEPVSTQLQIDASATELAQPESRELFLEQETFNVPRQETEKIAHIDDIASIEDFEAEVDALPINTAKSLEDNSSSPKSVSILEDGVSSAAVATSGSISAHEANAHTILSLESNSPKEFVPSQPTFNRADSSPFSAARSPGAARWTPEPPSTGSSPQLEPWSPKEVKFSLPPSPTAAAQGSQQPTVGLLPDPLSAGEANLHSLSSSNDIAVLGTASLGVASTATVAKVIYDEHQPLAVSDEALETEEIDSHILAASRTVPSYLDLEHDRSDSSTQTHRVDDGAIPPIVQIPEGNVAASFAIQSPAEAARSPGAAIWTPAPSSTDSSPALEPWSPKEVQFSFPAPSNETSIEPLELSSVSREIEGANEKSLGMEVTEKLEADSTIHANEESDESDSENNVSIGADKAILNASALGAVSVIGATAIAKALPSDEAAESPALESEYIEKSVPVEQVQLEQTTSSQSSHIKETSDFNSSETSNLEDSISFSTEHHQTIESVPLDVGSPAVPHRSPGADVWTPAPSSTDSSPAIEPWSPKEVHFSLPNSPVLNDQSRSHFSSDLTDVPPTELMEPISLDESAEHVQANTSLDESHKASETEYPATGEPFAVSVLHDEVTSSFVESTKDDTEPVAKPEVEASDPNSHSSTDSFAIPGIAAGVVASVAAGVGASHVIKAQLENSDDEDNASIPPMTESSSISRAIDSPVQADICEPRITPPTLTISDINGVAVTEEETDESDLETSDIINDHDGSPIQTDDFEDKSSSHDDSSDQEEAATSSEKSSVEPLINERATAINQAIRFPDSVHRSPGASIWTPEPSSTESSPDLVPWSPKEVHFSLPNSPIVVAGAASASMSATVPGEIEPLVLAHNSSEAVDQADSDLESVNEKLTSPKMTEDFDNSVTRETETSDSKSSNFGESSFALPIAAAAATAAAVVPAVLSSESEDSTVARDLVEGASTEDSAHFSGMEFASVDDNFKSNAMESEQAQDLAIVSNTEVSVMKDESISRDMEITSVPDQDSSNSVAPTSDILPSHAFNTTTPKLALRSPGADVWTPKPPSTDSSPAIEPWSPKEVQFSIPDSPVVNDADISKLSTEILPPLGSAVNDITTDAESESEFKDATFEQSTSPVSQPIHFDKETSSASSASQNLVTPSSPRSFLEEPLSVSEISSDSESDEEFKFSAAPTDKNEQTVSTPRNFSDFETSSSAAPAREFSIPASELYKDVGVFIPSDPEQNDQFVSRSYPSEPSFSTQRDDAENRNEQQETHENSFGGFQTIAPLALGASALGAGALLGSALPVDSVNSLNTNFTSESTSTLTVSDSLEGGSSNASFVSSVDKSPAAFSEVLAPQHRHSPSRSVSDESFVSVPEDQGDDNRLSMASSVNILESFVAESTQVMEDYPDFAPQSPIESVSSTRSLESSPGDGNVTASLLDPVPRTVIDSHMGVQKSGFETQTINISASIPDLSSIQPEDDPLNSDSDCDDEKEEVNANSNNLPMESLFDRSKFVASETSDIRSSTPIDTSDLSYGKNEPLPGSAIPAQDSSLKSLFTFNETASAASSQPDVESYDEIDNNQDVDFNSDISDESSVIEQSPIQSKATKTEINDFPEDNQISTRGWEQENTDSDSDSDSEPVTVSQIPIQTEFVEKDVQDSSQVAPILVPETETEDHLEESSLTSESDSVVITKTPSHRSIGDHEGDEELQEKPASLPKAVNEEKPEESQFDFRDSDGDFDATPVYKAYGSPMEVANPTELVESSVWDKALDGESHANAVSGENSFFDFAETTVRSDNSFLATSEVNSGSPETPRSQVSFSSPTKTPAATTEDFESSVHQETEKAILQTRSVSNSTDTSLEDDWFALSKAEAPVIPASPEAPLPRSPDETFTFPSLNKPLPSIAAPVPEVDTHKSFADTLERDDIGLTRDINASNSTTSLSESIVLVDPKDKPLPSLAPSALLPDADVKSRRSPSVTLTPIVKETESVVKDEGNIIFAVCVVGFHHAHGPQVEYWKGCDGDQSKLWPDLPFQSLPDGSHSREENFCYFTLPYDTVNKTAPLVVPTRNKEGEIIEDVSDMDSATTLFGISCNRQISADDLKEKPADVTRSTVHKSVVVIARKPIFGPIREKLAVITRAFFEQGDFSDLSLIDNLYDNLNVMFDTQLDENDMYVGMSLRELIFHMKNNVLVLFKALLLEKKIIFYSKNTENLCSSQFSLVSLVPALLEHLEDSCSPLLHKYEDTVKKPLSLKSSDRNSLLRFMGLPLQPFSEGGMFNPYLPLQQFNKVNAPETKYFLVGSTNSLIVESCECDLVVKFDQGIVEFKDNNLKKALALSTNDKKWMDYITQSVVETWDPKDPWKPKGLGFHGSEDFVRQQFEDYIMGFMSSVKYDEFLSRFSNQPPKMMMLREVDGNPVKLFSQTWVQEWKKTNNYRIFSKLTDDEIFDIVEPKHMAMTLMPPKETHQRSASTLSQISFFSSKSDESKTQQQAGGATSPASTKTWGSFLWRKPGTPSSPTSPPSVRDEGLYPGRLRANTVSTNHSVHTLEPIMSNGSEDALDTDSSPSAKSASSIPPPAAPAPTTTASQAASARRTASAGGFLTGWSSFWGSRKPAAAPAAADSADTVPAVTTTPPAATSPTEAPAGADGLASPLPHPALQSPKSVDNPAN